MENEIPLQSQELKPKCGIIMPISACEGYSAEHWKDVLLILQDAIEKAGFEGDMVSAADEVNIIQKTIVQNLYNRSVVICDVSGRNANVMFELGIRLTFDKPTVIVCDDATPLPFDTSMIEHIIYPKTLRYQQIEDLKVKLIKKIKATHQAALDHKDYSPFLKHFGEFIVPKLNQKEVPENEFIIDSLNELKKDIKSLKLNNRNTMQLSSANDLTSNYMESVLLSYKTEILRFMLDNEYSDDEVISSPEKLDSLRAALVRYKIPEITFRTEHAKMNYITKAIDSYFKAGI